MADELKKTIKIRGGHRANATKTLTTTNQILTEFNPDDLYPEAAEVEIRLVQQRLNLNEKMATLKEFDEKIVLLIDEQDIEEEMASADDIRQDIQKTIVRIDSVLGKLQQNSATNHSIPETSQGTSFQQAMATTNSQPSTSKVRLPKLELKHFNGNLMDWAPFWDSYSSAIHENPSLSQVDKFSYLHSLLVNSAAEAIAGLKITSANYDEAVDILKKRFGNQQQIINAHMNSLLNLPGVTDVDNLMGLRQLHDKVESHMRGLKALGVDSGSYGSLFTSILTNKLPQELRLIATKQLDKDQWNLDELIKVFKKELDARERANLLQGAAKNPPFKPQNKPKIPSSSFLFSTGTIPTCTYCQQSHPSNSCSVVPDKNARKEILKMAGRCYICLKKNHVARECRSKAKCFKCDKRHHISICTSSSKEQPISSEKKENPPKPKDSPGKNSVGQSQGEGSSTHVNMSVNAKSSILL